MYKQYETCAYALAVTIAPREILHHGIDTSEKPNWESFRCPNEETHVRIQVRLHLFRTWLATLTTLARYAQQPTVTVLVGESKQAFFIHRELLRNASPYFSTRLKACWDGEKPCIDLPEVSLEAFAVIAEFIYSGQIPEHLIQPGDAKGPLWERLFPIYKAADSLMMVELQNEIVDIDLGDACRNCGGCWSLRSVAAAFEHEIAHTPYYQLVLNYAVRRIMSSPISDGDMERHLDPLSIWPQGMRDVLKMINVYNREPWGRLYDGDWCRFHVHLDGEGCKPNSASPKLPRSPPRSSFGRRM